VTPHGFGHAARAAAVAAALSRIVPGLRLEFFTTAPEWFFADSLDVPFGFHPLECDLGLVQRSALEEDPVATCARLDGMLPFREELLNSLAGKLHSLGCRGVVCDISPMGLAAARTAGLPSVLVESFTWDWIYAGYQEQAPGLIEYSRMLKESFETALLRVQAEPVCVHRPGALQVAPISRRPKVRPAEIRRRLDIEAGEPMILLSMGGIPWQYKHLETLQAAHDYVFVVPGGGDRCVRLGNLVLLPHRSGFHHPDLIHTADACVAKLGYSTVAEAYAAGAPMAFIPRKRFPESPVLAEFVVNTMGGFPLSDGDLTVERIREAAPRLLALPRRPPADHNGAGPAARAIAETCGLGR